MIRSVRKEKKCPKLGRVCPTVVLRFAFERFACGRVADRLNISPVRGHVQGTLDFFLARRSGFIESETFLQNRSIDKCDCTHRR